MNGKTSNTIYLKWEKFDFEIPSKVGTYSHIEDLGLRIRTLLDVNPEIDDNLINSPTQKNKFFDYIGSK